MGKKIRKFGRRKNYPSRRKVTVRKISTKINNESSPVIVFEIDEGYIIVSTLDFFSQKLCLSNTSCNFGRVCGILYSLFIL